jgi:hypothetical protein
MEAQEAGRPWQRTEGRANGRLKDETP